MTRPRFPTVPLQRRQVLASALAGAAGLAGVPSARAADSADPARLKAALAALPDLARQALRTTSVPGLAIAVVQGGRTVFAEGFGVRQAGSPGRVDADTVFELASVSKPLAATVVARQVGQGRVAWDTPLRQLLPWFALSDPTSTAQVTVGDMFAHRSGLPDHAGDMLEMLGFDQRQAFERLRLIPVKPLRTDYAYTNLGLTAAAEGVARAAGSTWAGLCADTLYAPLGMTRTHSSYRAFMTQDNRASSHMRGGRAWTASPLRDADLQSAAGGASSSVTDMARWLALMLADGRWQGQQLVAADPLKAMLSPQSPGGNYGYGINVAGKTSGGLTVYDHSGAFVSGASTAVTLVPGLDLGVVALSNAWPVGVPETVSRQFIDLVEQGRIVQNWWSLFSNAFHGVLAPTGEMLGLPEPTQPAPHQGLSRYAGHYGNDYLGEVRVEALRAAPGGVGHGKDRLRVTLGPQRIEHVCAHWSGDDFVFTPPDELASPGSLSVARFDVKAGTLWLEVYDGDGQGRVQRLA